MSQQTSSSGSKAAAAITGAERAARLSGMACLDTSGHPRLPILMELVGTLSRAEDPQEVLKTFSEGMRKLEGPRGYISLSTRGLEPGQYKITRTTLGPEGSPGLYEQDPWRDWDSLPVHEGGFLGAIISQAYPEVIHNVFLHDDPVLGDALADWGSILAVPLFDNGEPLNWAISLHRDADGLSVADLEEMIMRGNLVGTSVRSSLAARKLRRANDRIRREMDQIASIQRALLPRKMPAIEGVTLAATYETYDEAGGDYYDFFPLVGNPDEDIDPKTCSRWGILIADAAGHGPAAAVLMAMLHSILHCYPQIPEDPGVVLKHANEQLCRKGIESSFVTAVFGIYDSRSRDFTYARAGHPPPLIKKAGVGAPTERLDDVGSVPLGILPGVDFEFTKRRLEPGDTLVLYTDGITEAMSPDRAMFDVEGIEAALHECSGEPDCIQGSVFNALRVHEGGVRPSDDQTIVALQVNR